MKTGNLSRRLLCLLLVFVTVFGNAFPAMASATEDEQGSSSEELPVVPLYAYTDEELAAGEISGNAEYIYDGEVYVLLNPMARATVRATKKSWTVNADGFVAMYMRNGTLYRGWKGGFTTYASYFEVGNSFGYCIQPSITANSSTSYSSTSWSSFESDAEHKYYYNDTTKRDGVSAALTYGAPNNGQTSEDWIKATHALVLDVMCGYRDENLEYRGDGSGSDGTCPIMYDVSNTSQGLYTPAPFWYTKLNTTQKGYYAQIVNDYRARSSHSKIPSFATDSASNAANKSVTLEYNSSTGYYEAVLTDSNKILADYDFSADTTISGLTFTKNGNKLTIKATEAAAKKIEELSSVRCSGQGKYYKITSTTTEVYSAGSTSQHFAMLAGGTNEPVTAYFTVKVKLEEQFGYLKVTKQDASSQAKLSGAKFKAVDASGNTYYLTESTTETGVYYSDAIPLGTYTISETQAPPGYVLSTATQKITVTASNSTKATAATAGVAFTNTKQTGYVKVTKVNSQNTSEKLSGAVFTLTGTDGKTYTVGPTGSDGVAYSDAIPIGTYTVKETTAPDGFTAVSSVPSVTVTTSNSTKNTAAVIKYNNKDYVTNDPSNGYIEIIKTDATNGANLAGAVFKIKNTSTNKEYTLPATDSNGKTSYGPIPLGTYTVTEVTAPTGYKINANIPNATIAVSNSTASTAYSLTVKDERDGGYIKIYKKGTDTNKGLAGAYFQLKHKTTGQTYTVGPTDSNGYVTTGFLPLGTYTVTETVAPEGYKIDGSIPDITIGVNNFTVATAASVTAENDPLGGYITITKVDSEFSNVKLAGATFTVKLKGTNKTFTIGPTNDQGVATSEFLPLGTYEVVETKAPTDYKINPNIPDVTITQDNETVSTAYKLTVKDEPEPGEGTIKKTVNVGSLGGWKFRIYTDANCTKEYGSGGVYTTNNNGTVTVTLPRGTYWIKEDTSGLDTTYWDYSTEVIKVEIKSNKTSEVGPFENTQYGLGEVIKVMKTDGPKDGWQFKITDSAGREIAGSPFTTDSNGKILTGKLLPGSYTVTEIIPADSPYYCISSNPQTIVIEAGKTKSVTFENALKPGEIEILKVNGENQPLSQVKYLLEWSEDGRTWKAVTYSNAAYVSKGTCNSGGLSNGCLVTNASGVATFTNLYPNIQYRITEVETVSGTTLLAEPIIIEDLKDYEDYSYAVRVTNDEWRIELNTGSNSSSAAVAIGAVLAAIAMCGIAFFFVNRRRADAGVK